ncbi:MAG: hypothetical protein PHE02_10545 [Lachnospiraceae bacterium]|nr:hypothetical protein [Lachnospiraceae bacterium]
MENVNKRSYYALKFEDNSYAMIDPFTDFSLCGGNPFTLLLMFLPLQSEMSICLLKQEGAFEISYQNSILYYKANGMEDIVISGIDPLVGKWNSLTITYDGSVRKVYYQGLLAYKEEKPTEFCTNENEIIIGQEFWGYMRKFCCFDSALNLEEIGEVLYDTCSESRKSEAVLYFDFSRQNPIDYGRFHKKIRMVNYTHEVNLARTLQVNKNGYVQALESESGKYVQLFQDGYTLFGKIYLNLSIRKETILFNYGEESGITLGIKNETTGSTLFFDYFGERIVSTSVLPMDQWVDIAVTVAATETGVTIMLYADGELIGDTIIDTGRTERSVASAYRLTLGNKMAGGRVSQETTFDGYMDSFCVFNYPLTKETLGSFVSTPPYIFNHGIEMMFPFYSGSVVDDVSMASIDLINAEINLQEGTQDFEEVNPVSYVEETEPSELSAYEKWEATFAAVLVTSYIFAQTGIKPTTGFTGESMLTNGALKFSHNELASLPSVKNAVVNFRDVPEEDIVNVFNEIRFRGEMPAVEEIFYGGAGLGTQIAAATGGGTAAASAGGQIPAVIISLGCLTAIGAAALSLVSVFAEEDPPCDAEEEISISSISFHYPDQGGKYDYGTKSIPVSVRPFSKPDLYEKSIRQGREWEKVDNKIETYPICYIRSLADTLKIKVVFAYNSVNSSTTFTGKIGAKISVIDHKSSKRVALGDVKSKEVTILSGEEVEIEYELNNNNLKDERLGFVHFTWQWIIEDTKTVIGTSSHDVYVVNDKPVLPWDYTSDDVDLVLSQEMLLLWKDVTEATGEITSCSAEILGQKIVPGIYNCGKFEYETTSENENCIGNYSTVDSVVLRPMFYKKNMENDYFCNSGTGLKMTSLDLACLVETLFACNGVGINVTKVSSTLKVIPIAYKDGEENVETVSKTPIYFNDVIPVGKEERRMLTEVFHFSSAIVDSLVKDDICSYANSRMIDPSFAILKEDALTYTNTITFSKSIGDIVNDTSEKNYYREMLFNAYTFCNIDLYYNTLIFSDRPNTLKTVYGELRENCEMITGACYVDGVFIYDGRPNFVTEVSNVLATEGGTKHRCHQISFESIKIIILEILTIAIHGDPSNMGGELGALLDLLHISNGIKYDDTITNSLYQCSERNIVNMINEMTNYYNGTGHKIAGVLNAIDALMVSFNSQLNNLRVGIPSWNESIGELYDCVGWKTILYDNGGKQIGAICNLQEKSNVDAIPVKYSYETTLSDQDIDKIKKLVELSKQMYGDKTLLDKAKISIPVYNYGCEDNILTNLLGSSNNTWQFIQKTRIGTVRCDLLIKG